LVDMTREPDYIFSEIAKSGITKYIKQWKKIWILVNKKWYSWWIFCKKCGFVPKCDKCSVSISYHKVNNEKIWLCHICKTQYNFPQKCEHCWSNEILEFWVWTQQIAEILENEFKTKIQLIETEKANSTNKINGILSDESQVYIWTSLLNTPIKWLNFDLIIFLNADLWLNIPDYSAAKNNFYFLYDTFTNHKCKNFVVQSFNTENYSIRNACKLDLKQFTKDDNLFRESWNYPPFTDICVILYKNEIEERLFNKVDKLYKELLYLKEKYMMDDLEIYSTPPLIYKIFGKYRYNIILKWKNLRNFMDIVYTKLKLNQNWFKIDRQAESLI
jgi:primosomal protein N' (replication factor Y)